MIAADDGEIKINQDSIDISTNIVQPMIDSLRAESALIIDHTEHSLFNNVQVNDITHVDSTTLFPHSGSWPIVFGLFPLYQQALKDVRWLDNQKYYSCAGILKTLNRLDHNGVGFFFIERHALTVFNNVFFSALARQNLTLEHIICLPRDFFRPATYPSPLLITIRQGESSKFRITQIDNAEQASTFATFYSKQDDFEMELVAKANKSSTQAVQSNLIEAKDFTSVDKFLIDLRMREFGQNKSKGYKEKTLKEISTTKPRAQRREHLESKPNALYIIRSGRNTVTSDYYIAQKTKANIIQLEIDEIAASAEFLEYYFRTDIGRMLVESCSDPSRAGVIDAQALMQTNIVIPPLNVQLEILEGLKNLKTIRITLAEAENNLAQNPDLLSMIKKVEKLVISR